MSQFPLTLKHHTGGLLLFQVPENPSNRNAPIIEYDMRKFAIKIANQEVPSLVNLCNGKFEEIIDILIHPEVSTPRQVKKLLNTFSNNLLIANSREAQNRKLEQQLLTGENGIKFLAKLAVIQSDYNDVYMNLGKDFNYLDDLFNFYKESGIKKTEVKSSIKILFNRTESSYIIKSEYEGLMNFLSKTQHITVDNISPFIYLAQDAIGLKAGDEKQRTIRKQLISGNEKGIISLLKDEVNPENIFDVIVEEVKNSTKKDLPSIVSAAFQLINHLMETKKELANAISYKLTTTEITQIRYWQIEIDNIVEAYLSADNKLGIENALKHILDQLFWRSEKWKTPQGKEMNAEDFNIEISHLLDLLLSVHSELPESIRNKIKTFLAVEQEDFALFPFERVLTLYKNHSQLYEEYFGFPFFNQLVDDMEKTGKDQLVEEVSIFFEISHEIRENNTEEFIELMPSVVKSIPTGNVLDTMKLLEPIFEKIEVESGTKIVEAITDKTYEKKDDVEGIMVLLRNIPFNTKADDKFVEQLDNFFLRHLTNDNEDNLDKIIIETMEYIILNEKIGFEIFTNIFNDLIEKVITTSGYDELMMKLNRYFTDSQRTLLFNKINPPILLGSYNHNIFDRIFNLFAILSKDQENKPFIQTVMKQGISYFQNNQWAQNSSWANDFIKLFSFVSEKLEQSDVLNFVNALYNYVSTRDQSMVIKSFMCIGENIPESRVIESIVYAINNSNTDSSKFDTLDFLRANKKYINLDYS